MSPQEMKRLQAAELHEQIPETQMDRERDGIIEFSTFNWSAQINARTHKFLYLADSNNREIAILNRTQIAELIALLQRAQQIIEGEV